MSASPRQIALVGNPNCGKTTLFNALTGLRQKVGNYPGVTVEKKVGEARTIHGEKVAIIDLPGTYSLSARSEDERVARDVLLGDLSGIPRPDVVLCVVDASNLERNLYLVLQVIDLGLPIIIALNMIDVVEENNQRIDPKALSQSLGGVTVIPCQANAKIGIAELKQAISKKSFAPVERVWTTENDLTQLLCDTAEVLSAHNITNPHAHALTIIGDRAMRDLSNPNHLDEEILHKITPLVDATLKQHPTPVESRIVTARYDAISRISAASLRGENRPEGLSLSDKLDEVLIHPILGWLVFIFVMASMFLSMFTLAETPMNWIENGIAALGVWVGYSLGEGDLRDLLVNGVIAGVGSVLVFLPQILLLFLFIGILEGSGYMARAAFIMDRLMAKVGLNGKSFIPLLSSYACAIPGIMATRTIENEKDRLVTILVAPMMSCSARLPVYTILIGVMIPSSVGGVWVKAGLMFALYALGTLGAFMFAWAFKRSLAKSEASPFMIELPPYRMPGSKLVLQQLLDRGGVFIKRAGTIILALSIIIWAASTYPKPSDPNLTGSEALEHSAMGRAGKLIEPVVEPLGFDWKIGTAVVWSFAAREVFNSAIGIIYSVEDDEDEAELRDKLSAATRPDGSPVFSVAVCAALLVFYVFAQQCIATFAVVRRETASWKWPIFQLGYMTVFAWLAAFVTFQVINRIV